jgi:Flp pilus assembly protein TadG
VLVAVVLLFVVGAMAALSIDVVTLYTARSEAQLAADAGALAGARVFANSGVTSDAFRRSTRNAKTLATAIATQVASQNSVGGSSLDSVITVSFANETDPAFDTNPHVTVQVQRTNLPAFFSRIWGRTANAVSASATAEAYNPSGANTLSSGTTIPVAPTCVKPWLLPNIDPTVAAASAATASPIFDSATGAIVSTALVGEEWPSPNGTLNQDGIYSLCGGDCSHGISTPLPGAYYPGAIDSDDFPAPTQGLPSGTAGFNPYQVAVAGCVQPPIVCGANSSIKIDTTAYSPTTGTRDSDTVAASDVLIHFVSAPGDSDSIDIATIRPPLQFLAGNQAPVVDAIGKYVMVSDSLVTIPVINTTIGVTPTNPVQVIGFLQVFLNPSATATMPYATGPASTFEIPAMIINMAGCGTGATLQPILGNGASPVAVRLISPSPS